MADIALYLLLGLVIGTISGLIGIGGGVLIVPALIYLFSMTQHQAQGTTLSLLVPPIGLLAAWTYYKQGFVDIKIAAFICLGFFIGGYIGAKIAVALPADVLRKIFGFAMLLVAIHMIFFK
ncbi:sulfite exporter TauE/SafE family protein [candidate division KSB1 bacterium]|nr:sulfite exporter TauE/SafE family protein [candidate division KSB1 bacterium]